MSVTWVVRPRHFSENKFTPTDCNTYSDSTGHLSGYQAEFVSFKQGSAQEQQWTHFPARSLNMVSENLILTTKNYDMGLQPATRHVVLCGPRPHLQIMYILKFHDYLGG